MENKEMRNENLIVDEAMELETDKGFSKVAIIAAIVGIIVVLAVIIGIIIAMKGKSNKVEESKEPVLNVEETVVNNSSDEVKKEDETENVTSTEEPEVVVETEETMEDWLTGLGKQGTCVAIYNENTSNKYVITDGETYKEQLGDRYFICTPSKLSGMKSSTTSDYSLGDRTENYVEIFFEEFDGSENIIELNVSSKGGEEKTIKFTIAKNAEQKVNEEANLLGYEWANALGYEQPVIVVWNDNTGLRKELTEGETYKLAKDDQVAMYVPEGYTAALEQSNVTFDNVVLSTNSIILRMETIVIEDTFDLEISIMDCNTFETITLHATLTK